MDDWEESPQSSKKTKIEIRKLKPISRFKRRSSNRNRKEKSTPRRSCGTSWIQIWTYEELDEAWAEEDAGRETFDNLNVFSGDMMYGIVYLVVL